MCCSVLQNVAVRCSAAQWCSCVSQCVAAYGVLQNVAAHNPRLPIFTSQTPILVPLLCMHPIMSHLLHHQQHHQEAYLPAPQPPQQPALHPERLQDQQRRY